MTERWRAKLGDLDTQGPSHDVFERAKVGPTLGRDPSSPEPTAKRVFAGVAAVVVFALAIAIFVVPFLRTNGTPSDANVTPTLFPVWPSQTSAELKQLQTQADHGDASWALDPSAVAQRFGQDVMGWPDASVERSFDPYCFQPQDGSTPISVPCNQLQVGGASVPANLPPHFPRPPRSLDEGATKSYALFACSTCPKIASPEWVQLYQPLEQGDGGIWAVLQAHSDADLSVEPAQVVSDGATLDATFFSTGGQPTLGYGSCGVSQATGDHHSADFESTAELRVDLGDACAGGQAGYVWGAVSSQPLGSDPLNGGGSTLISLSVVPVTMVFNGAGAQSSSSATKSSVVTMNPSASMPAIAWGSHTDPYGWTIDVPKSWTTANLMTQGPGIQGAQFVGETMSVRITT
jgi:hypothetical protein